MARFSILSTPVGDDACCVLHLPRSFPDPLAPMRGEPMGDLYPEGFAFHMAPEIPSPRVTDLIRNALGHLMVTERVKELLEAHAEAEIEYLRFTLINHKGRVVSDRFYIVNLLGALDCADMSQSRGTPHPIFPGEMQFIERLFLDEDKIPDDTNLLRLSIRPRVILIRDDLRQILEDAGITGALYLDQGEVDL